MKEFFKSAFAVYIREKNRILERKTLYGLTIFLPFLLSLIFIAIYYKGVVREIPIAIYNEDNSNLSKLAIRQFASAPSMKIYKYVNSLDEIKSEFRKGNIYGAIYFPKNLEKDIRKQRQTYVILYRTNGNLIIGNTLLRDFTTIAKSLSGKILLTKIQKQKGLKEDQAKAIIQPIVIDTDSMFNPYYSYLYFLVPGLLTLTLYMVILVVTVLLFTSEKEHNTLKELFETANFNIWAILVGKATPHILLNFVTVLLFFNVLFPIFNIPIYGSITLLLVFSLLFVVSCVLLGMAISAISPDQQKATEIGLIISTPAFILSGFTFPVWAMPKIYHLLADLIPYPHYLVGVVKIYQMNCEFKYVKSEFIALSLFAIISFIVIAIYLLKTKKQLIAGAEK